MDIVHLESLSLLIDFANLHALLNIHSPNGTIKPVFSAILINLFGKINPASLLSHRIRASNPLTDELFKSIIG